MRLQPERTPDPPDPGLGHPRRLRHRPRRPVRRVAWGLLERLDDHPLDIVIADRARLARAGLIVQAIDAPLSEPCPPLADRRRMTPQLGPDLLVRRALGSGQHDPAPQRQRLRALRPSSPPLEHLTLLVAQHDLSRRPSPLSHQCLPSSPMTTTTPDPTENSAELTARDTRGLRSVERPPRRSR